MLPPKTAIASMASLVMGASALLMVPETNGNVAAAAAAASRLGHEQSAILQLPCQDCFKLPQEAKEAASFAHVTAEGGKKMALELKFEVRDNRLLLNESPLFPRLAGNAVQTFTARRIVTEPVNTFLVESDHPLSMNVMAPPEQVIKGDDGVMVRQHIDIEPIGLSSVPIRVPTIHLDLATYNGEMVLVHPITVTEYKASAAADACTTVLCRARVAIVSRIAAFQEATAEKFNRFRMGCKGRMGRMGGQHGPKPPPQGRHHHHHHHHHRHHLLHVIHRILHHIVLPILLGVFSGIMLASLATLAFTLARRMAGLRCCRRGEAVLVLDEEAGTPTSDEKDVPPKYEEVYREPEDDAPTDERQELLKH